MNRSWIDGVFCLVGVVVFGVATSVASDRIAKPIDNAFDGDLERRVDETVQPIIEKQQAVGYVVGLVKDGRVVMLKGYGWEDREKKVPVDRNTLFRWASVSKTVTAVAAMQLVEQGKLDLDRDVREYVPEFPDKGVKITTRQLLCHQSGIRHYANGKIVANRRTYDKEHPFESVIVAMDEFKDSPLLFEPGDKFSYSTHAFILLSAVVERAGKEKFADQVRDRVVRPIGMKTFTPDYQWKTNPHRAVGYRRVASVVERSGDSDVSWKLGGGGFLSNVNDMALYASAIVRRELVKPETWDLMWTRQKDASGRETDYGLGFRVSGSGDSLRVEHSGAQQKTRTHLVTFPNREVAAVALTNSEYGEPKAVCEAVISLVEKE